MVRDSNNTNLWEGGLMRWNLVAVLDFSTRALVRLTGSRRLSEVLAIADDLSRDSRSPLFALPEDADGVWVGVRQDAVDTARTNGISAQFLAPDDF